MLKWVCSKRVRCAVVLTIFGMALGVCAEPVGVNLDGMAYYFTQKPWVDAKNMFSQWFPLDDFSHQLVTPPLTADGYPIVAGTAISQLQNYPDGVYKVSYQGTGQFIFGGISTVRSNIQYDGATDTTSFDMTLTRGTDGLMVMELFGVSPTNPVRNLHMFTPGYSPSQTTQWRSY